MANPGTKVEVNRRTAPLEIGERSGAFLPEPAHVHDARVAVEVTVRQRRQSLREYVVFLGGFQAPFPPVVAHRLLLNCSGRGDSVTRDWPVGLRVQG